MGKPGDGLGIGHGTIVREPTLPMRGEHLGMDLIVPDNDANNQSYFRYCASGELRVQKCDACSRFRFPPSTLCPHCTGDGFTWEAVDGRGSVYTFTEVHHATSPGFKTEVPYIVAIVELDLPAGSANDEVRIVANLVDGAGQFVKPQALQGFGIGARVSVCFRRLSEDLAIPMVILEDAERVLT
jgi:uncharacterized OB-fold protein